MKYYLGFMAIIAFIIINTWLFNHVNVYLPFIIIILGGGIIIKFITSFYKNKNK